MLSLPKQPKIIEHDGARAVIEINELYPGYGATIGNALRRVLYSSLPGAAVTRVKFESAPHEFTTLQGVLEDVLELSLNLKQIRLILHGDEPQILKLKIKGKQTVTAKDIETPSQVEIINKDAHIATLTTAGSTLEAELTVERGMGYVQADHGQKEKKEIGVVHLDAAFGPVVRVNFEVQDMRVGDRTDYNRLHLELITDGTIAPEDAYEQAVKILNEHFGAIKELEGKPKKKSEEKTSAKKSAKKHSTKKKAGTGAKKSAKKK